MSLCRELGSDRIDDSLDGKRAQGEPTEKKKTTVLVRSKTEASLSKKRFPGDDLNLTGSQSF